MKYFACLAVWFLPLIMLGQQFSSVPGQGRSMVVSKFGIVSTPQFLASQAGAHILEEGGNAIDAAIAANAVMGVVQPYVNGIGGDLFMLYYEAKTGKVYGLNSSGWTPKALTIDYLKSKGVTEINPIGVETIDIPGAVAGWDAARSRFGTMPFSQLLAPAIYYAQNGFPLAERNARYWISKRVMDQPGYKETYVIWPAAPKPGDLFRNPALANSLRQIAAHGRDAYYNGAMTETMVKFLNAHGGVHTLEDFRDFEPEWVEPVSTTYRGWTVYELPPNGQGIAALSMLNIMENFPMAQYGHNSVDALHIMIEAKKLAYADMYKYDRRSALHFRSRQAANFERPCCAEGEAYRHEQSCLPGSSLGHLGGTKQTWQLHHLSLHHRQGREHRLAHSEQLCRLRYRLRRPGTGLLFP